jgi:hypothetical protein
MAFSVQQQTLDLLAKVQYLRAQLETKTPSEQLATLGKYTVQWRQGNAILLDLQNKIKDAYKGNRDAIPNTTKEQLDAIQDKLSQIVQTVETIEQNETIAISVDEISKKIENLKRSSSGITQRELNSLELKVSNLLPAPNDDEPSLEDYRLPINQGNQEAIEELTLALETLKQNHSNISFAKQDHTRDVSFFTKKLEDIRTCPFDTPIVRFNMVLAYYKELTAYCIKERNSLNHDNRENLVALSQDAILLLELNCDFQERGETPGDNARSLEMRRRLKEAYIALDAPAPKQLPSEFMIEMDQDELEAILASLKTASLEKIEKTPAELALNQLWKFLLPLLDGSNKDLIAVCNALDDMNATTIFKMSDSEEKRPIGKRPGFHLYYIHINEAPHLVNYDDFEYGYYAFKGEYPADNADRKRALQRTIIEIALQYLEDGIRGNNETMVGDALQILERLKLDPRDRIEQDKDCVLWSLHGAFYKQHLAARENDRSLIDPSSDPHFGNNYAFKSNKAGIDPAANFFAIDQVRNGLKTTWKVK